MKCTSVNTNTHTGIVSHSSVVGTQIGAFLSQFHGKGSPLLKDSYPQSLASHTTDIDSVFSLAKMGSQTAFFAFLIELPGDAVAAM